MSRLEPPFDGVTWVGTPPDTLESLAARARLFADSDDLLLSEDPFGAKTYVVDLVQRGVPGADLVRLLRRRCSAAIVALCPQPEEQLVPTLKLGADVATSRTTPPEHLEAMIEAMLRRIALASSEKKLPWRLLADKASLVAPDTTAIHLTRTEVTLLGLFAQAGGRVVRRNALTEKLWGGEPSTMDGALQAVFYRLRRRVEQAGQTVWPMHAVSGVGYEFRAPLAQD